MSVALTSKNPNDLAKEELDKVIKEKEKSGGFARGELTKILKELSEKYGASFYSLKNYYYRNMYREERRESKETNDQDNENTHTLENMLRTPALRPKVAPYKYGDIVDVEVTKVVSYGVFVQTLDGYEYKGLIHVSEIKNDYVNDINMYFSVGDKIKAKVKKVNGDKIEFSTKGFKVTLKSGAKGYYNESRNESGKATVLGEKLSAVRDKLKLDNEDKEYDNEYDDKEYEEIIRFINGLVGAMSPEAKQRMKKVIKKHGLFKFTVAMTKVSQDFKPDLGLIFINEVDKKVAEGL